MNNVSRREGRPLIVGLGNLRGIFKKTGQRTKLRRRWGRHRRRRSPKEVVRACVPPTMYSAGTFRAHNNGPRWWNEARDIWMGRTAHSVGRSAAQTARSTLPAPLSNTTRYGSTPTIGELRYAQPVKERPELCTTPGTQPSPTRHEQPSVLARLVLGQPEPPTSQEFDLNAAIYRVCKKNRYYCKEYSLNFQNMNAFF